METKKLQFADLSARLKNAFNPLSATVRKIYFQKIVEPKIPRKTKKKCYKNIKIYSGFHLKLWEKESIANRIRSRIQ